MLVAVVAILSLAGSAGGSGSAARSRSFQIIALSHSHPGGTYSWFCAKIRKTTKTKATVTASGPGATYPGERYKRTLRWKGTKIVAFKIVLASRYRIKVRQGTQSASKRYTVPPPTGPAGGPFPCVKS